MKTFDKKDTFASVTDKSKKFDKSDTFASVTDRSYRPPRIEKKEDIASSS